MTKKPEWNQQVVVFEALKWSGEPSESEEMAPVKWFPVDNLPWESMWEADRHWLPQVLEGKTITADFVYDKNHRLQDFRISEVL